MLVIRCSRAVRSLDCAAWIAQLGLRAYHLSELQVGGGAPPCVPEGLLGLLIEAVVLKAAHTHRECVVRLKRAVV